MSGNKYYTVKKLGVQIGCLEKFLFGVLISSIVFFLLLGPFWLFSTISPFVGYNNAFNGVYDLNILIDKKVNFNQTTGLIEN